MFEELAVVVGARFSASRRRQPPTTTSLATENVRQPTTPRSL